MPSLKKNTKYSKKRLNKTMKNKMQKKQKIKKRNIRNIRKSSKSRKNPRSIKIKKVQNKSKKVMKGGAIPFSELGNVADNVQYMLSKSTSVFHDAPISPNNSSNNIVNPNPAKQFAASKTHGTSSTIDGLPSYISNIFK